MGYRTPNIDRVANEGVAFTDYYTQQSCTAGRAAFITGQNPVRTGLSKVGMPGADVGLRREDPTIAELLKPLGYATGQFGKNHLGDKDEFLPTMHGFEEFFGNLYHLNAEEEPEDRNTTAMHFRTHCAEKHKGKSGQGDYNDAMVAHDENVGRMLTKLDDLGIAEDALVMYTTDNGPHYNTWPDAGITPFHSEKNTNWEGGWRVPAFVRWPG
jgi:arylsulfatase A-like enzyme